MHTKHINTVCGQNVELLNVTMVVNIVTTGMQRRITLQTTVLRDVLPCILTDADVSAKPGAAIYGDPDDGPYKCY
jgi:hypothetical protein